MTRVYMGCLAVLALVLVSPQLALGGESQNPATIHAGGRFGDVVVYSPPSQVKSVVLFVSGDGGWALGVTGMARHLADEGALVVGIDVRHYLAKIGDAGDHCVSLAGDFEQLSHDVQRLEKLPNYLSPILVGYSSGATIAYAVLAQAPPGTFAGAMSLGFCADQDFRKAKLCPGLHYAVNKRGNYVLEPAKDLQEPWISLQGQQDMVCDPAEVERFAAGIPAARLVALPKVGHGFGVEINWLPQFREAALRLQPVPAKTAAVADLPLVEVAVAPGAQSRADKDLMVVLVSGDGGWAGIDRKIAAALSERGVPVVGLDSLQYFWKARTPQQTAQDISAVMTYYSTKWRRARVVLMGYSFGADVLPFVVNRLQIDSQPNLAGVALIEPSTSTTFEIHVSDWLPGVETAGLAIAPELARLRINLLCLHGDDTSGSVCRTVPHAEVAQVGHGHHLSGDADTIVERVLTNMRTVRK